MQYQPPPPGPNMQHVTSTHGMGMGVGGQDGPAWQGYVPSNVYGGYNNNVKKNNEYKIDTNPHDVNTNVIITCHYGHNIW